MRLTDIVIKNLPPPPSGQRDYRDDNLPGLACRVSQGGTKTFVLIHGTERRRTTIGRYPILGLADARAQAKRILAERTLGKHAPPRMRISEALPQFFAEKETKNKRSSLSMTRSILNMHYKALHSRQVADIKAVDISHITDRLIALGYPSAANHALVAGRTFFRWCARRGYIQHSPIEHLQRPSRLVTRERVLSDDELHTVWQAADETGGHFADIVKLLILTGQRRTEIGSLQASWISSSTSQSMPSSQHSTFGSGSEQGDATNETTNEPCTITLPSDLTKNRRTHTFPISALAADILRSNITKATTILFPARGKPEQSFNGWSKAKAQLDEKIAELLAKDDEDSRKLAEPWTLHDLRRTYATNLQRLGIKLEVIESLLNHVSGTRAGIVGVYNRHRFEDEMREAVTTFDEWFKTAILQWEEL